METLHSQTSRAEETALRFLEGYSFAGEIFQRLGRFLVWGYGFDTGEDSFDLQAGDQAY